MQVRRLLYLGCVRCYVRLHALLYLDCMHYYIRLRALLYLGCVPYSVAEKVQIFALQLKLFKFLKLWQGASISHFVRLLIGR